MSRKKHENIGFLGSPGVLNLTKSQNLDTASHTLIAFSIAVLALFKIGI
jgi:hypothetical protein